MCTITEKEYVWNPVEKESLPGVDYDVDSVTARLRLGLVHHEGGAVLD